MLGKNRCYGNQWESWSSLFRCVSVWVSELASDRTSIGKLYQLGPLQTFNLFYFVFVYNLLQSVTVYDRSFQDYNYRLVFDPSNTHLLFRIEFTASCSNEGEQCRYGKGMSKRVFSLLCVCACVCELHFSWLVSQGQMIDVLNHLNEWMCLCSTNLTSRRTHTHTHTERYV